MALREPVPLGVWMLVQVPDGKLAQEAVREHLVHTLGFDEAAVRVHTADEPDPDRVVFPFALFQCGIDDDHVFMDSFP